MVLLLGEELEPVNGCWEGENQFLIEMGSHIGYPIPNGQPHTHVHMGDTK